MLPLFHVHGLGNGICCVARVRVPHAAASSGSSHARRCELFQDFRPTLFFGVPTMYVRLLELPA